MATVRDIVNLFGSLTPGQNDELSLFRKHSGLFNAGIRKFHSVLTTRRPENNWFVVSSQSSTPGQDDYFAPLVIGTREYALPPNFHHMRMIESLTDSYTAIKFRKLSMTSPDFKETREFTSATQFGFEALYDIIGSSPGTIMFAGYPPTALNLRLWYCRVATVVTAITDSLSGYPDRAPELIAQWCATKFLLGADFGKWQGFEREWQADIDDFVFGELRDDAAPSVAEGFLE